MLDLNQATVLSGLACGLGIAVLTAFRQRRLQPGDLGSFVTAFFAGNNLPVAIWLCLYGFTPDPPSVQTKLHGYEKYVALSGACLLFMAIVGLGTLFAQAYASSPAAAKEKHTKSYPTEQAPNPAAPADQKAPLSGR